MLREALLDGTVHDLPDIAIRRLQTFCPPEGYYVAFSGGKDSIVILDLVRRAGVKHDAHFHITTVDPPELMRFIRTHYPDVERHHPDRTMWQLILYKMMPPTRVVRYCCEHLKERGGAGRHVVTGVRWSESVKRSKRKSVERCMRDRNKVYVNPIIEWTDAEVWEYIRERKLPYCELYDQGFKRIGCVGCPMAGKMRKVEFARWPGFERSYKRAFAKIAVTGAEANRKLHWKTGDEVFDWWMADKHDSTDSDQGVLFE